MWNRNKFINVSFTRILHYTTHQYLLRTTSYFFIVKFYLKQLFKCNYIYFIFNMSGDLLLKLVDSCNVIAYYIRVIRYKIYVQNYIKI